MPQDKSWWQHADNSNKTIEDVLHIVRSKIHAASRLNDLDYFEPNVGLDISAVEIGDALLRSAADTLDLLMQRLPGRIMNYRGESAIDAPLERMKGDAK